MKNISKPLLLSLLVLPVIVTLLLVAFGIVYTRSWITRTLEDNDALVSVSKSVQSSQQTSPTGAVLASFTILDNTNQQYINLPLTRLEIADTDMLRTQGLMFRKDLCYSCGMLFVFEEEQNRNFWMKDTLISLDIVFIKQDGTVINIAEKTKTDQTLETYTSREPAQYVLEINAGWSRSNNLKPGSKLKINVT